MIASLRGTLLERTTGSCVVECGGVGYLVSLSQRTARTLPEPGGEVTLLVHQVVREDAHMLFGFVAAEERRLFELLISVSGVGPKVGLAVLSGLDAGALARAIRDENIAALVAVPGVGRKTAERLVVDLRDKLDLIVTATTAAPSEDKPRRGAARDESAEDAVAALLRLGYSGPQAVEAVRRVREEAPDLTLEDIVRRALARLARVTAGAR